MFPRMSKPRTWSGVTAQDDREDLFPTFELSMIKQCMTKQSRHRLS